MSNNTPTASKPYNPFLGCPRGYKKRGAYTHKVSGRRIPALCILKKSGADSQNKSQPRSQVRSMTKSVKKCPAGYTMRKGYIRKFRASVRRKGYSVHKKEGRTYRIFPKKSDAVEVKSTCVKIVTARGASGELKRGQLRKHGYQYRDSEEFRRKALRHAVQEYTPIGVYNILKLAASLARTSKPAAAKIFAADRDWIRSEYNITGSLLKH
jgi:hypothetical protein